MLYPLKLTEAKNQPDNFNEIFLEKAYMGLYLKKIYESEHYQQLFFELFCKIILNCVTIKLSLGTCQQKAKYCMLQLSTFLYFRRTQK